MVNFAKNYKLSFIKKSTMGAMVRDVDLSHTNF